VLNLYAVSAPLTSKEKPGSITEAGFRVFMPIA